MKSSIKALALVALCAISSSVFAYRWGFTNITDKVLVIKLRLVGTDADFFNIVQPGARTEFDWGWGNARAGFCLSSIILGEYNPNIAPNFPGTRSSALPKRSDNPKFLDISRITKAIDDRGPWFFALGNQPLREPKVVFIKNAAWGNYDKKIRKAAENLTKGIAKTAEEAAKLAGEDIGNIISKSAGRIVKSIMMLAKSSKCMSREFDVIEKDGEVTLFTKE